MPYKVSVSNLSKETTNERFKEVFSAYGKVAHSIIMRDRGTEALRGFGFVDYSNEDEVTAAVEGLNNTDAMSYSTTQQRIEEIGKAYSEVKEVPSEKFRRQDLRDGAFLGSGYIEYARKEDALTAAKALQGFDNLSWKTTDNGLRTYFAEYGQVLDAIVVRDPGNGRSRGHGFVSLGYVEADAVVKALDGFERA
ncbi:hypothetical protein MBLNU13_g08765t1 [Cladosporium sp. NU13]